MARVFASLTIAAMATFGLTSCGGDDHPHTAPLEVVWMPEISKPSYPSGDGPRVLVDAAHGNWHTVDFRFKSYADLVRADGYRVGGSADPVTEDVLDGADVFVIANAVLGGEDSVWVLPTPPALTSEEVAIIERWVREGGSLLLIADHMPFPASVDELATAFGLTFHNGYARPGYDQSGLLVLSGDNGLLTPEALALGNDDQPVREIRSYMGQAFAIPEGAVPLMRMPDDWRLYLPSDAFVPMDEMTPSISVRGLYQGALLEHGQGRVAVFGEAAMFTAQAFERPNGDVVRVGLNDPDAPDNAAFVLHVMAWLTESSESSSAAE